MVNRNVHVKYKMNVPSVAFYYVYSIIVFDLKAFQIAHLSLNIGSQYTITYVQIMHISIHRRSLKRLS